MYIRGGGKQTVPSAGRRLTLRRGSVISRFLRLPRNRRILSPVFSFSLCFSRFVSSPFSSCSSSSLSSAEVLTCLSLSHDFLSPSLLCLSSLSLCCLISSSPVPGHGQGTNGTHARVKRASGGRGWCLGRVSALLLVLPLNDVSPTLLFRRSLPTRLQPVASLWAEGSARSISAQLSVAPSELVYSFYCRHRWDSRGGNDPAHIQLIYTHTHTLKQSAARAVDKVAMATGCPASVSEHLYSIRTRKCDHIQEHAQKKKQMFGLP